MRTPVQGTISFLACLIFLFCCGSFSGALDSSVVAQTRRRAGPRQRQPQKPRIDYSRFSHHTHVQAQKLACDSCHKFPSKNWKEVRKGDDAFPDVTDFPEHHACINCHRTQFFARERPAPVICSNCHVAVTPRNTARHPFPSLGAPFLSTRPDFVSEFKVAFPHDKHVDVVGSLRFRLREDRTFAFAHASYRPEDAQSKSCVVCHKTYQPQGKSAEEFVTTPPKNLSEDAFWLKKGAFKTTPTTHSDCSTCHNEEAGIAPSPKDCAACHKFAAPVTEMLRDFDPKLAATMRVTDWVMLRKWSRRSAGRYRHEFDVHNELGCTSCHNPAVMNTLDERTFVSVKSCGGSGGCHIETNTEGILNYEIEQKKKNPAYQCVKCHVMLGKNPVPHDHVDALPKATTK
jgi:hypothetical protein